ncbi:MAG: ABC transporter permease [Acidimicrobiia bacterium]
MRDAIRIAGRDHIGTAPRIPDYIISLANLWHRRELLWNMTVRHLRGQYKQSVLGYAWALVMPLAQMIILTFVFSTIIRIPSQGVPFALFLFVGLLPWNFFSSALASATDSVVGASSLVTKVYFPREILPAAAIFTKVVDLAFASLILIALMVYYGHSPEITIAWVPLLFLTQFLFTLGLSLPLAALNLFFHDVRYLVGVALTLWFYLTPIIYPIDIVPTKYHILFDLNPLSLFINAYRRVLLQGESPDFEKMFLGLGISLATFIIGYYIFKKTEPGFADRI